MMHLSVNNLSHVNRHEDGTVRFWDASGVALTPLYKLGTANVFHTDCDEPHDSSNDQDMQQEEEWPPFRKVGTEKTSSDPGSYFSSCGN